MQIVLERSFIDKPMNFDDALIQLSFYASVSCNTCKDVFNLNVSVQSNCGEDLHFSVFI